MRNSTCLRGIRSTGELAKSMSLPGLLSLLAVLALFSACAESPAEPRALEPELLAMAASSGNGAIVQRAFFNRVGVVTIDFQTDLVAFHYADSDVIANFIGCTPSPFHGGVNQLQVFNPSGRENSQASGEVYVIVYDLAGFPGNVFTCQQGLAEGPILIKANFHLPNGPILFSSNGAIRNNADGSDIRLHQSLKLDGSFNQVHATVTLR